MISAKEHVTMATVGGIIGAALGAGIGGSLFGPAGAVAAAVLAGIGGAFLGPFCDREVPLRPSRDKKRRPLHAGGASIKEIDRITGHSRGLAHRVLRGQRSDVAAVPVGRITVAVRVTPPSYGTKRNAVASAA